MSSLLHFCCFLSRPIVCRGWPPDKFSARLLPFLFHPPSLTLPSPALPYPPPVTLTTSQRRRRDRGVLGPRVPVELPRGPLHRRRRRGGAGPHPGCPRPHAGGSGPYPGGSRPHSRRSPGPYARRPCPHRHAAGRRRGPARVRDAWVLRRQGQRSRHEVQAERPGLDHRGT